MEESNKNDSNEAPENDVEFVDEADGAMEQVKKLKEALKTCKKERQEYLDGWHRARADYLNSKRRYEEGRNEESERVMNTYLARLLPICDSFEHAQKSFEDASDEHQKWTEGFAQVHAQFSSLLAEYGVAPINPVDEPFDPECHDAISSVLVEDEDARGKVVEVLQRGYRRGAEILRPAKVTVGE